ncbi:MAG: TIGR03088 family PEP-CTERM/XrtA system glycosyltransferase [Rhodoferax sp.]|nr:TIGR03088 family PEP-CTERM/XrtA system glycosyltransferase [Rhodoferax sp.]
MLHVVHRFDTGGLENGLVNLINHMPAQRFRHAVMALTEVSDFRLRVQSDDVQFIALNKSPGHGVKLYPRVWHLMRQLRPAVVHSRNLGPLEMQVAAAAAGVPVRLHGEHGRDMNDLDGSNRNLQRARRLYAPFVHHWVALSADLRNYLIDSISVPQRRTSQIYNGVDEIRFSPSEMPASLLGCPFGAPAHWLIGTVGRMQGVKAQTVLARAFIRALELEPTLSSRVRLVMVGEGPLRAASQSLLAEAGVAHLAWLPGERGDVADVMRALNCFVLPSLAEGVSNTILEAMASSLPVIATRVGGNPELVDDSRTGYLVPADDVESMAQRLIWLAKGPAAAAAMGREGRRVVVQRFSMQAMVGAYQGLYDQLLTAAGWYSERL